MSEPAQEQVIDAVLFDMDGVLYHGERVIPEALAFMQALGDMPRAFVTNNPILTPAAYVRKLERLGFSPPDERLVVTAGLATARHLAGLRPGFRYYAIGAPDLHSLLAEYGEPADRDVDFVVVGEGPGLDFDTLTRGINLVLGGAELVLTNPDNTVDAVVDGRRIVVPGGGSLVAPFEVATGRRALVIGKPEPALYQMAMEVLGVAPGRCLMIGDRPDTDILGASRLGLRTALVRTGRFGPGWQWDERLPRPDWDVNDLAELAGALEFS